MINKETTPRNFAIELRQNSFQSTKEFHNNFLNSTTFTSKDFEFVQSQFKPEVDFDEIDYPEQIFALHSELTNTIPPQIVAATYQDMHELGIDNPPYDFFGIKLVGFTDYHNHVLYTFDFRKEGFGINANMRCGMVSIDDVYKLDYPTNKNEEEKFQTFAAMTYINFIVLMATKNIAKTTKESKLHKLGIGGKRSYKPRYTTTLRIGLITENADGTPIETGKTVRPHLRRGHIRRQRFGPNRVEIRKIFIQPCFVNADETFINARNQYNISI